MFKKATIIGGMIILALLFAVLPASAQSESMTLSITPPLVNLNVNPGQVWKSQVKLVNNNPRPMTAYVQVRDFRNRSDNGTVEFLDPTEAGTAEGLYRLSHWIDLIDESVEIEPYGSRDINYVVLVPEDAAPGGHYAAILAGTTPPDSQGEGSVIRVSSLLASLILLNVSGDILEKGDIREFSADRDFYSRPEAVFTLRFENQGNTHVLPRGDIRITAPFSRDREIIPINHGKETGNVLPGEIRKWTIDWKGDANFWQMGRYRADLTLIFGENTGRHTVSYSTFFWVVYWQLLLVLVGSLSLLIALIFIFIKISIRRSIKQMEDSVRPVRPRAALVRRQRVVNIKKRK